VHILAGVWILLRYGSLDSLFPCHIYNPLISRINAHLLNSTYQLYNMTDKKTIVVLGATGNQGGSVVNALLQDSQWDIRGVTRNNDSEKARKLATRGVEVVSADLNDAKSLEAAFAGVQAIFIVSDFWGIYGDPANASKPAKGEPLNLWAARAEKQQLINAIDAASKVTSLERLILSSLPNCSKWSNGKYTHVYHFDFKAQAAEYAEASHPDLWAKTSVFTPGWFLGNYLSNPLVQPRRVSGIVCIDSSHTDIFLLRKTTW
jgi:NAD(P)-dependent dehydrogenase (short-subunit alcohol dehydrogenase family)